MQADAAQLASAAQQSQDVAAASASFARGFDFDMTRELGNNFLTLSQLYTNVLATSAGVAAYYAQPRIVLISTRLVLLCQLGRYPLWHAHEFTQQQLLGRFEPEPVADLAMYLRQ